MALNRITSGSVAMTFLSLVGLLGVGGAFTVFACASAMQFLFTLACLPETKGKTLEGIEAALGANNARSYHRVPEPQIEA